MGELLDRLIDDETRLATDEGQRVGTEGHERARSYLEERLERLGLERYDGESFALEYQSEGGEFANLIGVVPGEERELPPLLLGAHYDTYGELPGADDNAAAVAIVLAVAERLLAAPARPDVVIAFFDAEEPPYYHTSSMTSTRFYRDQLKGEVRAALILDLVGHNVPLPGLKDLLFITGMESSPCLEPPVGDAAETAEVRLVTALNKYVGDVSDHHAFRLGGTPYLFFSCGRWEHYHMPTDTPEVLNYRKMESIVKLLTG
ncbi:MAG: M28 family peptidase [Trueperaceae bacterium]